MTANLLINIGGWLWLPVATVSAGRRSRNGLVECLDVYCSMRRRRCCCINRQSGVLRTKISSQPGNIDFIIAKWWALNRITRPEWPLRLAVRRRRHTTSVGGGRVEMIVMGEVVRISATTSFDTARANTRGFDKVGFQTDVLPNNLAQSHCCSCANSRFRIAI